MNNYGLLKSMNISILAKLQVKKEMTSKKAETKPKACTPIHATHTEP
jgi:hypothetical protein